MSKFSIEKKGYSVSEVDDFILLKQYEYENLLKDKQAKIDELRLENFAISKQLNDYKQKEQSISSALILAQEKAKEIKNNQKIEYFLELKNLDDFYQKWERFFDNLIKKYPAMQEFSTNKVLELLKSDINKLLENNFQKSSISSKNKSAFESLLDKLRENKTKKHKKAKLKINDRPNSEKIIEAENELEYISENNKLNNIKPITNLTLSSDEKEEFDSLLDKFLHSNNNISKGYESSILNTKKKVNKKVSNTSNSGFDLEKALNPTDDLLSIMKGFNLD